MGLQPYFLRTPPKSLAEMAYVAYQSTAPFEICSKQNTAQAQTRDSWSGWLVPSGVCCFTTTSNR